MPIVTNDTGKENDLLRATADAGSTAMVVSTRVASLQTKGVAVDSRTNPRANLLVHIEGHKWVVDYYSQVLNSDSQLSGLQPSVSAVNQQFLMIKDMEMRVSSPLSTTQDEVSKTMIVQGTAVLYPFTIPNEGNMFTGDLGDGTLGLFRITRTVKLSIFKEACYEITYILDTDNEAKLAALAQKVVKVVHFHKDFLTYGQSPLLIPSEHHALLELEKVYDTLMRQYFKRFFSNEFKTLMVPGQGSTVYDGFLVRFVLAQFTTWDSPEIRSIRRINTDDDETMSCDSLWRALAEGDMAYLNTAFTRAGLVSTRLFTQDPCMDGIRYTGIERAVYPLNPVLCVDGMQTNPTKGVTATGLITPPAAPGQLSETVWADNLLPLPTSTVPAIHPVAADDFYVLSEHFYKRDAGMSSLEALVWNHLEGKEADLQLLVTTAKRYTQWGALEQFYYAPILMVLIRAIKRGM